MTMSPGKRSNPSLPTTSNTPPMMPRVSATTSSAFPTSSISAPRRSAPRAPQPVRGASHAPRIGLGKLAALPDAGALERFERVRLVQVDDGVELVGHPGVEVVRD